MTVSDLEAATLVLYGLFGTPLVMLLVWLGPERLWPAGTGRPQKDRLNLFAWLAYSAAQLGLSPALGGLATYTDNAVGGGLIVLPAHGYSLVLSAVVYFLAMDLAEYVFHRAQHAIPAMWAMHSLHHSDPHFDATTSGRHFWLEPVIKSLTVWLVVGVLFKTPIPAIAIYAAITHYNVVVHSNTRLYLGRFSWLINTPAYHRLHHSAAPEHWNCNFAALLPIWDVIFGGYRRPGPLERPRTGLDSGEAPRTVMETAAWPLLRPKRRPEASGSEDRPEATA
jgi:sterol desaturase/sphingolipid hydroxylase (fatty acid hydroxylase superfamily)